MKNLKYSNLYKKSQTLTQQIKTAAQSLNGLEIFIMSLDEFAYIFNNQKKYKQKYFTSGEISYCKNRISSFAGRFAVKNAISLLLQKKIPWKNMEILPSQTQQPILSFSDHTGTNRHISISITHEDDLIAAAAAASKHEHKISIGIDATKISRFSALLNNQPHALPKILTLAELKEFKNSPEELASIWTAKEAVSKALGTGICRGASLQNIEITNLEASPRITLNGSLLNKAHSLSLRHWQLEFISGVNYCLAVTLAQD